MTRRTTQKPPTALPTGTGRVTARGGVCGIGLSLRMGVTRVSAAAAAELFPHFELLPGERRPEPGEMFGELPVFCWLDQQHAAQLLNLSARHLANLRQLGMPSRGNRETREYPVTHITLWYIAYRCRVAERGRARVDHILFRLALAEADLEEARARAQKLATTADGHDQR